MIPWNRTALVLAECKQAEAGIIPGDVIFFCEHTAGANAQNDRLANHLLTFLLTFSLTTMCFLPAGLSGGCWLCAIQAVAKMVSLQLSMSERKFARSDNRLTGLLLMWSVLPRSSGLHRSRKDEIAL